VQLSPRPDDHTPKHKSSEKKNVQHVSDAGDLASYAAGWLREPHANDDERVSVASRILERLSEDP
jgi:hypothetical protein